MENKFCKSKLWFYVTIIFSSVGAVQSGENFYSDHEHGWFFYETPTELTPDEPDDNMDEIPEDHAVNTQQAELSIENSTNSVKFLSVAWIREFLPKYRDLAIDEPTFENLQAYLYLQRIVLEKSSAFASVFQNVVIGNPELDAVSRRPIAAWGSNLVDRRSEQIRNGLLQKISSKVGILYIIKSEDSYCNQFTPILKRFADSKNFAVKTVSLDSVQEPTRLMENITYDPRAEYVFGIRAVPAVLIFTEDGSTETLVQGLVSEDELGKRMLVVAHRLGVISDLEFDESRPLYTQEGVISQQFNRVKEEIKDSAGFIEPSKLIKLIEQGHIDNEKQ